MGISFRIRLAVKFTLLLDLGGKDTLLLEQSIHSAGEAIHASLEIRKLFLQAFTIGRRRRRRQSWRSGQAKPFNDALNSVVNIRELRFPSAFRLGGCNTCIDW
jgi:hypothetical protein